MPKLTERVLHCWKKTRLLQAWDTTTQREAAEQCDRLFKKADLKADLGESSADFEEDPGAGLMEEEMSEEDAWEMVKDFIQEGHVPLAVARAADVAGDRK